MQNGACARSIAGQSMSVTQGRAKDGCVGNSYGFGQLGDCLRKFALCS
jgi:hypothetical protein